MLEMKKEGKGRWAFNFDIDLNFAIWHLKLPFHLNVL